MDIVKNYQYYQYSVFVYVLDSSVFLAFFKTETKYLKNERSFRCSFFTREQLQNLEQMSQGTFYRLLFSTKVIMPQSFIFAEPYH